MLTSSNAATRPVIPAATDVEKDLFVTNFTRLDGYRRMVWTTAHFDRNHWDPEDPMNSIELFVANEYRAKNPDAESVVRWLVRPE
jgi:hypothetical protein